MSDPMPDTYSDDPVPADVQARVLREFVASSPAGFLMLDHQLRHIEVSPRWMVDWGVTRSALLGKYHYATYPNLPDHIKDAHRRALAGEVVYTAYDRFMLNGREVRCAWEVRPWGKAGQDNGGILIYAEDLAESRGFAAQGLAGNEGAAVEAELRRSRSAANGMSHGVLCSREGRSALQDLLSEYREIACTCEKGYYDKHRAHQVKCRAHASVPLISRAEQAIRQLLMLEEVLIRDWSSRS
jgi:PAS domain S-box-containing protein